MSKSKLIGFAVAVAGLVGTMMLALSLLAHLRTAAGL